MPIIVDANRASDFTAPLAGRAREILEHIYADRVKVVVGGRLKMELAKTKFGALMVELSRLGRLRSVPDDVVNSMTAIVGAMGLVSDDPHVLALARVSNSRLVYTNDENLMKDLKNLLLISPRGKIITSTTSSRITCTLLRKHPG